MKSKEELEQMLIDEQRLFCSLVDPKKIHDAMIKIKLLEDILGVYGELQGYGPEI